MNIKAMGSAALLGLTVVLGMGLSGPAAGTAETTEGVPKEGRIGLQIHAGADWSEGSRVRFRNIRLTEL
jgi:hypothetical protein